MSGPSLTGRRVYLTGGANGIGRAIAERFAREDASLVVLDRSAAAVAELEEKLAGKAVGVVGDVSEPADHEAALAAAKEHFGGIDVVIANAAIFDGAATVDRVKLDAWPESFREIFEINVLGYLLAVAACRAELIRNRGAVVFTASFASFNPAGGGVLYTASKHAVIGLMRQLAHELAPHVRVNAVAPGVAPTRLSGITALGQEPASSVLPDTVNALPLGKIPVPDDYTGLYALLASAEEAKMVTGSVFHADSGLSIRGLGGRQ